jgi:hypothetical protein
MRMNEGTPGFRRWTKGKTLQACHVCCEGGINRSFTSVGLTMNSNYFCNIIPPEAIGKLPVATCNKLRSTQILTSLPQVISELLQNALDAGARQVDVGVDCEEWTCWVRDNGGGITKDGMNSLGMGSEVGRYSELVNQVSCMCVHLRFLCRYVQDIFT